MTYCYIWTAIFLWNMKLNLCTSDWIYFSISAIDEKSIFCMFQKSFCVRRYIWIRSFNEKYHAVRPNNICMSHRWIGSQYPLLKSWKIRAETESLSSAVAIRKNHLELLHTHVYCLLWCSGFLARITFRVRFLESHQLIGLNR